MNELFFFPRAELFNAGHTVDGDMVDGFLHYAVAESVDGRRWMSPEYFSDTVVGVNPETGEQEFGRQHDAPIKAERIVHRFTATAIIAGNQVVQDIIERGWLEIDPRYGSEAYERAA